MRWVWISSAESRAVVDAPAVAAVENISADVVERRAAWGTKNPAAAGSVHIVAKVLARGNMVSRLSAAKACWLKHAGWGPA